MSIAPTSSNHDYAQLRAIIKASGLLGPQDGYYSVKLAIHAATLSLGIAIALIATHPAVILADAVFLAFGSTQMALLAHDIIHKQAFRGRRSNAIARLMVGNLFTGLSWSWWKAQHNQHHANPNHIDKDPDIQLPFIVFAEEKLAGQPRWRRPFVAFQAVVLVLLFPLQAFGMRMSTQRHLRSGKAPQPFLQTGLIVAHFALFGWLLVSLEGGWLMGITFFFVHQVVFGVYNSSVFASNHKGMPLTDDGTRLDFLREQVMTSRDVDAHRLTDFWYGGLNYQIEHHLFPTMPRNNLGKAKPIIVAFCEERGIAFESTSLTESYRQAFGHLHSIGSGLRSGAET